MPNAPILTPPASSMGSSSNATSPFFVTKLAATARMPAAPSSARNRSTPSASSRSPGVTTATPIRL
jgi:hypothetical protein